MKYRSNIASRWVARVLVTAAVASTISSARATVLEQKWVAGQQLSYDLKLSDSTLTLQSDAAAPFFWAGVPWEVTLDGTGEVALDTRAVDESGAGTVAVRLPRLQMNGSAMGMFKAVLDVQNGLAKLSINGQPANGRGTAANALVEPATALEISRYGRVQRLVPLRIAAPTGAGQTPQAKTPGGLTPELSTLVPTALFQALPQLWPGRDIKVGEKWTVQPKLPMPARANTAKDAAGKGTQSTQPQMITLGNVDMTLVAQETLDGRSTQRVAIQGTLSLDGAKVDALMPQTAGSREKKQDGSRRLITFKQSISGDIWFDDVAGQMVKMEVRLNTQSAFVGEAKPKEAQLPPRPWKSYQNFDGTLAMQLRTVS